MTNITLAQSYMIKASNRLDILDLLLKKKSYSDVIRESQEIVELALKAMLRHIGIDPPKWHDVGMILLENSEKFPVDIRNELKELADISKWLRTERELSFYGDIDFIPTEEYDEEDAIKAINDTRKVMNVALRLVNL